jgi:hypothetical protein
MNIRSESFGRLPELDPMRDGELIATLRAWPATAIQRTAAALGPHRTGVPVTGTSQVERPSGRSRPTRDPAGILLHGQVADGRGRVFKAGP